MGEQLLFYVLGVPMAFSAVLYTHRVAIREDQQMRMWGEGGSIMTNPNLHVRLRFRKLYEDYKPTLIHWKVWQPHPFPLDLVARQCRCV